MFSSTTPDILKSLQLGAWSVERGPSHIDGTPTPSMFDRLPFTFPFNLTGQPAASVPCGFTSEGLPVALKSSAAGTPIRWSCRLLRRASRRRRGRI